MDEFILRYCFFCFQDIATLGAVGVKYCGYTATVQIPVGATLAEVSLSDEDIYIEDQPDGGSNALNVNRQVVHIFIMFPHLPENVL